MVSAIARVCTDAIGDELRLRAAMTDLPGAAFGARCVLAVGNDAALGPDPDATDLVLRHRDVVVGTLRMVRREPFSAAELELASLIADQAAAAWRKHEQDQPGLAAIVSSTDDAIIGKTLDGIITSWNHGAEKLFGYTFAEVRGRSITILIPPERLGEEDLLLAHLRAGRVTRFETVRRCKSGKDLEVAVTSSPVYDGGGRLIGASKVARDITSRRVAERSLARAVATAQAANRELEAFSYSVAHDLRAPLRAISGFSQILLEDHASQLDDGGRRLLDDIRAAALTMGGLIDALLSLARLTRREVHRERTDLAPIVRKAIATLAIGQPEREVEVITAEPLIVEADPRLARVLVDNLIGNAWKFTGKTANARIEVGEMQCGGARTFYVRDNGAGFDMAHAANLFGPFRRLHSKREFVGTGIGLATAERIVDRHGGRIWAESAVNTGATFFFTLEAAAEAPP